MEADTPEILLARYARHGQPEDLAEVFDRTAQELLRLALHLVTCQADAEDLLQATFLTRRLSPGTRGPRCPRPPLQEPRSSPCWRGRFSAGRRPRSPVRSAPRDLMQVRRIDGCPGGSLLITATFRLGAPSSPRRRSSRRCSRTRCVPLGRSARAETAPRLRARTMRTQRGSWIR